MKKRTQRNKTQQMSRTFMIAKVFLALTPVIAYFYVSMNATAMGVSFQEILVKQPSITIIFLIAMVNPYIAYLISLIQKKLEQGDHKFALINMGLLLIAQALTMNAFYFVMLLYVFYKAISCYHVKIAKTMSSINFKQSVYNGGGGFLVIMISTICLFATIRLM